MTLCSLTSTYCETDGAYVMRNLASTVLHKDCQIGTSRATFTFEGRKLITSKHFFKMFYELLSSPPSARYPA